VSFEAAMARLGGSTFLVSPDRTSHGLTSQHGIVMDGTAAEHLSDVLPVLASYADILGIRLFAELRDLDKDLSDTVYFNMASCVNKPLINLESAARHPCQSLADWKTLDESAPRGNRSKLVLSWAFHPNALSLSRPISTLYMAAMRGMEIAWPTLILGIGMKAGVLKSHGLRTLRLTARQCMQCRFVVEYRSGIRCLMARAVY